jgi:hypothetical protein
MPIKYPATSDELKKAGYEYDNDSRCRSCGEPIEWWITPSGSKMPMVVKKAGSVLLQAGEVRVPHWADCPNANDFRKRK